MWWNVNEVSTQINQIRRPTGLQKLRMPPVSTERKLNVYEYETQLTA